MSNASIRQPVEHRASPADVEADQPAINETVARRDLSRAESVNLNANVGPDEAAKHGLLVSGQSHDQSLAPGNAGVNVPLPDHGAALRSVYASKAQIEAAMLPVREAAE